jgi:hypothetical protein
VHHGLFLWFAHLYVLIVIMRTCRRPDPGVASKLCMSLSAFCEVVGRLWTGVSLDGDACCVAG